MLETPFSSAVTASTRLALNGGPVQMRPPHILVIAGVTSRRRKFARKDDENLESLERAANFVAATIAGISKVGHFDSEVAEKTQVEIQPELPPPRLPADQIGAAVTLFAQRRGADGRPTWRPETSQLLVPACLAATDDAHPVIRLTNERCADGPRNASVSATPRRPLATPGGARLFTPRSAPPPPSDNPAHSPNPSASPRRNVSPGGGGSTGGMVEGGRRAEFALCRPEDLETSRRRRAEHQAAAADRGGGGGGWWWTDRPARPASARPRRGLALAAPRYESPRPAEALSPSSVLRLRRLQAAAAAAAIAGAAEARRVLGSLHRLPRRTNSAPTRRADDSGLRCVGAECEEGGRRTWLAVQGPADGAGGRRRPHTAR